MTVKPAAVDVQPLADILKFAAAEIAIQFAGPAANLLAFKKAAAGQEKIQLSIPVKIDQGHAAAQRFENRQMPRLGAVLVAKIHARGCGDVTEKRWPLLPGRHIRHAIAGRSP